MSQALYRKWRPHLWEQVIGQEHVVRTLQNAIRTDRVGHAYLFSGPRGTGKTTSARLLAKAVNCLEEDLSRRPCDQCAHCQAINENRFLDLIEIDAASNTSVEDVRDLRDKINYSPAQGRKKVYIIDEVHMLSTAAFNALLKTLEEPPEHAIFILATTEVHKIPATVLSRCQRHEFRRIPVSDIVAHIKNLCQQEKLKVDEDALTLIARQSTGSMRDAISLLDQLASSGEHVSLATAQKVLGTATNQLVIELVDAILARQAGSGLSCIQRALDSGSDSRQFARQVVDYLRGLMMTLLGNSDQVEATPEMRQQMQRHASEFDLPRLTETIRLFNAAASDTNRSGWQPSLPLELALAEAVEPKSQAPAHLGEPAAPIQTQAAVTLPPEKGAQQLKAQPAAGKAGTPLFQASVTPPPEKGAHHTAAQTATSQKSESTSSTPAPSGSPPGKGQPAPAAVKQATAGTSVQPARVEGTPPDAAGSNNPIKINFHDLIKHWDRVHAAVKKQRFQTEGLMNSCKPLTVKDGVLILGFKNDLLKKKMEAGDNLSVIRQGIQAVLGMDVPIACVVMTTPAGGNPTADLDIEGDGIVGTALNLGGKIVRKE